MTNMDKDSHEVVDWSEAERTPEELEAARANLIFGSPFHKKERDKKPKPDKRILRKDHLKFLEILLGDPDAKSDTNGSSGSAGDAKTQE